MIPSFTVTFGAKYWANSGAIYCSILDIIHNIFNRRDTVAVLCIILVILPDHPPNSQCDTDIAYHIYIYISSIFRVRGGGGWIWAHKSSERSCICVLVISISPLSTVIDYIWELFPTVW
jgi:hypothetical protein